MNVAELKTTVVLWLAWPTIWKAVSFNSFSSIGDLTKTFSIKLLIFIKTILWSIFFHLWVLGIKIGYQVCVEFISERINSVLRHNIAIYVLMNLHCTEILFLSCLSQEYVQTLLNKLSGFSFSVARICIETWHVWILKRNRLNLLFRCELGQMIKITLHTE